MSFIDRDKRAKKWGLQHDKTAKECKECHELYKDNSNSLGICPGCSDASYMNKAKK